jgi:hypothetical protein
MGREETGARVDLIKLKIPAGFIVARAQMSWRELLFGLVNQLLDPQVAIDFAIEEVSRLQRPSSEVIDLAGASRTEPLLDLVERLAAAEPEQPEDELRNKWLYLTLAWLYEQRENLPDPLQTIEVVYADFGYPKAIAGFVRYMPKPMDEPDLGSREANEHRLLARWRQYVDSMAKRYRP